MIKNKSNPINIKVFNIKNKRRIRLFGNIAGLNFPLATFCISFNQKLLKFEFEI